ncbi:hypothetical protein, partial [Nocardioides sp.]|uniref:hypothetical protein n=1 Tax=Nocardioides sp. TaxID=35761 RepID=UPI003564C2EF
MLPPAPAQCPTCGLPLQGGLATQLFETLSAADALLIRLRESAPTPSEAAVGGPVPGQSPVSVPPPASVPPPPLPAATTPRRGFSGASVPKILLTLGALCLLVAAVIFLAVAWSWLGVGGR